MQQGLRGRGWTGKGLGKHGADNTGQADKGVRAGASSGKRDEETDGLTGKGGGWRL